MIYIIGSVLYIVIMFLLLIGLVKLRTYNFSFEIRTYINLCIELIYLWPFLFFIMPLFLFVCYFSKCIKKFVSYIELKIK